MQVQPQYSYHDQFHNEMPAQYPYPQEHVQQMPYPRYDMMNQQPPIPAPAQPMMGQGQPMGGQPMMGQPIGGQPMMGQPIGGQPMGGQPMFQPPPAPPGAYANGLNPQKASASSSSGRRGKGRLIKKGKYWPGNWLKLIEIEKPVFEADLRDKQAEETMMPQPAPAPSMPYNPPQMYQQPVQQPMQHAAPPPPSFEGRYYEEGSSGEAL
ncbi:hypothetical protein GUITHDRAFT_155745 [Guillardia theta CCMP2712]|uniref:Uncharacterized protein n=1 Tax=Guillardia theta (strain CCMP2712) TaxID=905079 RepID=L1IES6_GUITC|nr:hypothetical protein GUITHDRAFT_155745 [Guillardia theta CCMP2712]EKX34409.1 hypothetical protein GUITHDRAFT_155745 [Guillardia theta CCMP2712]|eukprot:XP_005821389.1 hypothetical protein GUITHDRAFT_155745 [Guillardia theta CCMP2712]